MKITPREKRRPFLAWGDFHARSRFACSTISEEKWGTTRSLQLYETDENFGEHYDRRLARNQKNARTQTLFFHQISDYGTLAVKNEDGMGRRKERTIFGASQLAAATLTARLFGLAGRHFFPFKKLKQRRKFPQSS